MELSRFLLPARASAGYGQRSGSSFPERTFGNTMQETAPSGKELAREEIFVRRAQLAQQMERLGMPPMVDSGAAPFLFYVWSRKLLSLWSSLWSICGGLYKSPPQS